LSSDVILTSEIRAHICLIDDDHLSRVQISTLLRCLHAHAKSEWNIRNAEYDHACVARCVLCDSCEMAFEDVVTIQVGLFTIRLHPNFILAVFGQKVEARDIELEFTRFCKFAEDRPR